MKPWIQCVGATWIDLLDPTVEQVRAIGVRGFADALAHLNRFTGWAGQYSVALHSINVARCLESELRRPDLALAGLWHDGAEAATGDISTPMKWALGTGARDKIRAISDRLDEVIAEAFGVPYASLTNSDHLRIKQADLMVLKAERAAKMPAVLPPEREADWAAHFDGVEPATSAIMDCGFASVAATMFVSRHVALGGRR